LHNKVAYVPNLPLLLGGTIYQVFTSFDNYNKHNKK
jgi:hypothetical protein